MEPLQPLSRDRQFYPHLQYDETAVVENDLSQYGLAASGNLS